MISATVDVRTRTDSTDRPAIGTGDPAVSVGLPTVIERSHAVRIDRRSTNGEGPTIAVGTRAVCADHLVLSIRSRLRHSSFSTRLDHDGPDRRVAARLRPR
ncbi:hypothetical protein, partial [Nocardia sp. NPDC052112]|uniref:hypothetical protein n=1 Tax=Nocardia sp. NPDC052112 TaxID=3155646 RepID=UPI0034313604